MTNKNVHRLVTTITIMGISVKVRYIIRDPYYVEWNLEILDKLADAPIHINNEMQLLNLLLRVHYSDYIESICREAAHYDSYAATVVADEWAKSYEIPWKTSKELCDLFTNKEDIPF